MKKNRIEKLCAHVFRSWRWQNNVHLSKKGSRIVVGWDASNVKCSLVHSTCQSMLYLVEFLSLQQTFFCSFIYVANKGKDRRELLKDLILFKRIVGNVAWTIMGDVNVSLTLDDHFEGISHFTQDMIDFQYCINEIEMEDLNFSGLHFTWTKSLMVSLIIDCYLDFPQAMENKNKSFRFANYLDDKLEFKDMLKDKWNEDIHGHAMFRLVKKKAKVTWLKDGDKNSAYFHKLLKGRLNRNRIMSVCDEDGNRYENNEVAKQFVKHIEGFMGINPPVPVLKMRLFEACWSIILTKILVHNQVYNIISKGDEDDSDTEEEVKEEEAIGKQEVAPPVSNQVEAAT
ncbi:RNA-directed DNA polymerase, eukaryota, reverse transcriptase zinc-binding domain protein [Tanacetum coccineum]